MSVEKKIIVDKISSLTNTMVGINDFKLKLSEFISTKNIDKFIYELDHYCTAQTTKNNFTENSTVGEVVEHYIGVLNENNIKRKYYQTVNMPQMALTGLSESWLFKELGDCHWRMLCENIGLRSNEIVDEFGARLYASFIRIRFENTASLMQYDENDLLDVTGRITRIGNSLYYGQVNMECGDKIIRGALATTFTARECGDDNSKLTKGVPSTTSSSAIVTVSDMPDLVLDHVKLRKNKINIITLLDYEFKLSDKSLFEYQYSLNPYFDINGVGLLYFAAYPIINDYCELKYFNDNATAGKNWAMTCSTVARDVFYFANCNIDDVIVYRLNDFCEINDNIYIQSTLLRKSDDKIIAKIFTIKKIVR